jgi:hypothetical protein
MSTTRLPVTTLDMRLSTKSLHSLFPNEMAFIVANNYKFVANRPEVIWAIDGDRMSIAMLLSAGVTILFGNHQPDPFATRRVEKARQENPRIRRFSRERARNCSRQACCPIDRSPSGSRRTMLLGVMRHMEPENQPMPKQAIQWDQGPSQLSGLSS